MLLKKLAARALRKALSVLEPPKQTKQPKVQPWNRPESFVRPEPWNCPVCGCRIERALVDGIPWWFCAGCKSREEIETYVKPLWPAGEELPATGRWHSKVRPPNWKPGDPILEGDVVDFDAIPSCGWSGKESDLGTKWMSYRPR